MTRTSGSEGAPVQQCPGATRLLSVVNAGSTTPNDSGDRLRAAGSTANPAENHCPTGRDMFYAGDQPPVAKPGKSVIPPSTKSVVPTT